MTSLFKNTFRVESTRRLDWNYADDGMYFVTICTQNKFCYFGEVVDEKMCLNNTGQIANAFWLEIPKHFSNVILDEYIIMPNHIHGIIFICNDDIRQGIGNRNCDCSRDEALPRLYAGKYPQMSKISPKPRSLPVTVGSYKSICKKIINRQYVNSLFAWQPRFYDRIIRNEHELHNVRDYIYYNPVKWDIDKNNQENLLM